MRLRNIFLAALLILSTLALAGCDAENNAAAGSGSAMLSSSSAGSSSSEAAKNVNATMDIKVYYPDENATGLYAVTKTVKTSDTEKYKAAVEALLAGTDKKSLTTVFPKKTKLLSVKISGKTAMVNFDKNLTKGFVGGSTGEEMLVGSLVNTLTEFPEIKSVQILVEGEQIDSLAGHFDLSEPVERMPELIQ